MVYLQDHQTYTIGVANSLGTGLPDVTTEVTIEGNGKIFPVSDRAIDVLDALLQRLVEAAHASMAVLIEVLDGLGDPAAPPGPPLASQLSAWAREHGPEADPATALRAVLAWSRLHGFVSLEIAGNYASMNIDPDQVFEIQLATLTA